MRNKFFFFAFACVLFFSSFISKPADENKPKTITKSATLVDGKKVEKTIILLDGSTSREDLIHTCNYLAQENVQLTFEKLTIGRSFLGLVGKQRIRIAEGKIQLPNGASQSFKGGGVTSFKSIKIQYSNNLSKAASTIEMIEISN